MKEMIMVILIENNDMKKSIIRCERCGEKLTSNKIVWLELSVTDGYYYKKLPKDHESQGSFSFGSACAKTQLKETKNLAWYDSVSDVLA